LWIENGLDEARRGRRQRMTCNIHRWYARCRHNVMASGARHRGRDLCEGRRALVKVVCVSEVKASRPYCTLLIEGTLVYFPEAVCCI
jgi:hypothetical protein